MDLIGRLIDEADGYGDGPVVVHDIEGLRALLCEAAAALKRAKRPAEALRPTKEKLELVASVLGEVIAAHDEMLDEVGYSPFNRRRLDEAALAVVEMHASEVWS